MKRVTSWRGRLRSCSLWGPELLKLSSQSSCAGLKILTNLELQVALENGVSINKVTYQLAHDRATFMAASKVQKLLEEGGPLLPAICRVRKTELELMLRH